MEAHENKLQVQISLNFLTFYISIPLSSILSDNNKIEYLT